MGGGRWDSTTWSSYATTHIAGKTDRDIFKSTSLKDSYDPAKFAFRESRDGVDNPVSTPIILGSDVTGSMGMIAVELMKTGLNKIATEIYDRKPVTDPHICVLAIGDAENDRAPIQATQFEADIRIADQVRDLWVEGGGGANGGESYSAAHVFAGLKTRTDASEKRGRKGYLFTIGDEPNLDGMTKAQIKKFYDIDVNANMTAAECLALAERNWHVFHIVLQNEGYARHGLDRVLASWKPIMPERTILLQDFNALAETVVSLIQVTEGALAADVARSWGGGTSLVVANALSGVPAAVAASASRGLRRLGA